ncbi:MAG: hypothetical protein M1823_006041 [Watsoniomyces obsoletus]|nr:MAG: hypothetical protein M1823_006041 [Watsoniomyces obsoletus]
MTSINGRDAYGRPISLLNEQQSQQPLQSWESCWSVASASSPDSFLATPDLWRSSSCSSRQTTDDSSPATPADGNHSPASIVVLPAALNVHPPLLPKHMIKKEEHSSTSTNAQHQQHDSSKAVIASVNPSSSVPTSPSSSVATVSTKPMPKKYPCQFADTLDCREMFTTSGHASRHAKRHTGEKNVPCPRCPKRFARKDNMKQHLKTHEEGTTRCNTNTSTTNTSTATATATIINTTTDNRMMLSNMLSSATPSVVSEDMSSRASSVAPSCPTSPAPPLYSLPTRISVTIVRPPLRRSSATHHIPRRAPSPSSTEVMMMDCTPSGGGGGGGGGGGDGDGGDWLSPMMMQASPSSPMIPSQHPSPMIPSWSSSQHASSSQYLTPSEHPFSATMPSSPLPTPGLDALAIAALTLDPDRMEE